MVKGYQKPKKLAKLERAHQIHENHVYRSRDALVFCSGLQRGAREFESAARAPALGSCVDPVCLRLVITVP
ncbi:hypothetical protein HPB48_026452 [Haemaphysalis longicornis]|uniref:Uncharacterized protein n=1 Tax=Haemaphysalis longicornis TaxID=44386 RepID=A0A9J6HCC1_HAELO|nr:hypothetical protein HPB48_026452 [Haemaphysalis longicornis]